MENCSPVCPVVRQSKCGMMISMTLSKIVTTRCKKLLESRGTQTLHMSRVKLKERKKKALGKRILLYHTHFLMETFDHGSESEASEKIIHEARARLSPRPKKPKILRFS